MSIKLAVVNDEGVIVNIIIGNSSLLNESKKFLSVFSELKINDVYSEELALIENFDKETSDERVTQPSVLKKIVIRGVVNALKHDSSFTRITCYELENLTVLGAVDIPDQSFSMPIKRDDGRLILFPVQVINGAFEAVLNFSTSGQYIYTDEQANHDFPEKTFTVDAIKVDVLRRVQ